ncbi:alpha-ribazole-5-phosphate synthase [Planococcus sp. CPCC 101016]|uniref:alpha-ribazole-5-phosphate synthase n=1 Tax=Planococcus sp. CPCC 101016 TaxID=2599617 RepID=UPI0011B4C32C|nr:alpha-ribazole-5-phosphate synthase [Planococcus sp. CPCC 101016]TWT06943.1 alpha-ribazole-5-phosphate synthase [Planococcus sp. CPCC 101016]
MRHEILIDGFVITSDNSAGIGEKEQDVVKAPDAITAKFAGRVALLEQWAAGSQPQAVLLHNFSGAAQWTAYMEGIKELFDEAETALPQISGSTETNMPTLQSGIAVTMIGKQCRQLPAAELLCWFVYGIPLVGEEVLTQWNKTADLALIGKGIDAGLIERVWPVGSQGIAREAELLMGRQVEITTELDQHRSGGPATCVLVGVMPLNYEQTQQFFGENLFSLRFE